MVPREQVLTLYRNILKHGRFYPSKNRVEILCSVHEFFKNSKKVTDPEELQERLRMAEMLLANFKMYHAKVIELRTGNKIVNPYPAEPFNRPGSKDFIYF